MKKNYMKTLKKIYSIFKKLNKIELFMFIYINNLFYFNFFFLKFKLDLFFLCYVKTEISNNYRK